MEISSLAVYVPQTSLSHFSSASVLIELDALSEPDAVLDEQPVEDVLAPNAASVERTEKRTESLQPLKNEARAQFWQIFGSTFITIFLAELGDKTQVATLLMSADSHDPWSIFTGAAIALVTTSLLGVLVGQWLSSRVSPKTLDTAAGMMLALLSAWLLWDVVRM